MRVKRLDADQVHGYLSIRAEFFPDLTFLTGLNGSGKTTALRLLIGLLAPDIEELIEIKHGTSVVTITEGPTETFVLARRNSDGFFLQISTVDQVLNLTPLDLQEILRLGSLSAATAVREKYLTHPVYSAIAKMSTPMFLGLDRGFMKDRFALEHGRTRSINLSLAARTHRFRRNSVDTTLPDVNALAFSTVSEIRLEQERLDEELRNEILLDSFRYHPVSPDSPPTHPSPQTIAKFRQKRTEIENAAASLHLPIPALQTALDNFFTRAEELTKSFERLRGSNPQKEKGRGAVKSAEELGEQAGRLIMEWVLNQNQTNRIVKQLELLEVYLEKRAKLREPIDRFVQLANSFLVETKKQLVLTERGHLRVRLDGEPEPIRPITALSSGERQIVVMLGHLSLDKTLQQSGVFIIDEPELSLHISWQERFVDAIQAANPNVQLIMATHSPAIILDKTERCLSLSEG